MFNFQARRVDLGQWIHFPFTEVKQGMAYLETGRAKGRVVLAMF